MCYKSFIVCPRCKEFIGDINGLDECPLCGYDIVGRSKNEETEID